MTLPPPTSPQPDPMPAAPLLPLLDALRADALIQPFLKAACAEHRAGAGLSPALRPEQVVIISPDDYYNARVPYPDTPKSPDCLVVVQCTDGTYTVYVVELKDVRHPRSLVLKDIRQKFETCLGDFMSNVLRAHFFRTDIVLRGVRLLLVANPYENVQGRDPRLDKNSRFDALLALTAGHPLRFAGQRLGIKPNERNPLIAPC